MDFCLHVVKFGVSMMFHYALCFPTEEARHAWIVEQNSNSTAEWLGALYTKEELKQSYSYVLGVEERRRWQPKWNGIYTSLEKLPEDTK